LPVQLATRVDLVRPGFTVSTTTGTFTARDVVLATGPFQDPFLPAASRQLSEQVHQIHSLHYRRPQDLPTGDVAVVGGGNSAAQIALELSAGRRVTLVAPQQPWYVPARVLGVTSYWWLSVLGILGADAEGRLARRLRRRGDAVFGTELREPLRRGQIGLRPHRVVGAADQALHLADGSELPVTNVVWCTGFHARYDWLDVPGALVPNGNPAHSQGASPVPGLHWMGLPWQSRLDSSIVHGVNADARRTAERVLARQTPGTHPSGSAGARRPRTTR
jgi:putative flavoprotein involved in K+ transport